VPAFLRPSAVVPRFRGPVRSLAVRKRRVVADVTRDRRATDELVSLFAVRGRCGGFGRMPAWCPLGRGTSACSQRPKGLKRPQQKRFEIALDNRPHGCHVRGPIRVLRGDDAFEYHLGRFALFGVMIDRAFSLPRGSVMTNPHAIARSDFIVTRSVSDAIESGVAYASSYDGSQESSISRRQFSTKGAMAET
jgi:hypothetical protein